MQHSLQVQRGHLVYDPFVGTGSILVAAAYYGAYTLGADIDIRVVRDGNILPTARRACFCNCFNMFLCTNCLPVSPLGRDISCQGTAHRQKRM